MLLDHINKKEYFNLIRWEEALGWGLTNNIYINNIIIIDYIDVVLQDFNY